MILYHGSTQIIKNPEFGKEKITNDYGRGFYCTEEIELAKEWASTTDDNGVVNIYELDVEGLNILYLNKEPYHILNWLSVLARNRSYWQKNSISEEAKEYIQKEFAVDVKKYDVVIGYRADDSYFSFAQDFVNGSISLNTLSKAMKLGKLGLQVVLISEKAFSQIRFLDYQFVDSNIYYSKRVNRDQQARKEYRDMKQKQSFKDELYMLDILREEIKNEDPRLR